MLMALHPSVQERARHEIDSTIGRVPRMSELYRLPYLLAVLKEVMRYAPVGNLGGDQLFLSDSSSPVKNPAKKIELERGISRDRGVSRNIEVWLV
jgi:hypothetical protein